MSHVDERKIVGELVVPWAESKSLSLAMPNRDFTPPDLKSGGSWARVSIQQGQAFPLEISGPYRQHRHPGLVVVQLFAPTNKGDAVALGLADELLAVFRHQRVAFSGGSMLFRTPYASVVGTTDDGWFQVNVTAPFIRDAVF